MFLLDERANTSCNTISDSAINYRAAEAEPVRQSGVELAIDVRVRVNIRAAHVFECVCVFELRIERECRERENK